jgi:YD repeat-containing protein
LSAVGRLGQIISSAGDFTFGYDALGRLTDLVSADGTRYRYDANGNRTQKITAAGTTTYTRDAENRLAQVTLPDGKSIYVPEFEILSCCE